ncbi:MAG: DUF3341 domain-containing protein [Rhodothermales bacterium]|nr:DUF3341 domain-containing protein [Rhodothermales bacterium]
MAVIPAVRQKVEELRRSVSDKNVGLLAEFENPGELVHAVEAVREAGYTRVDTFTPFPIHGMDKAMGLSPSKLGYIVIGGGLTGCALAFLMQWWMGAVDYPLNISGKPLFAIEPSVPIAFELTILFSALGAVAGMLALNGLPKPYNPLFYSTRFTRATDDGFFLQVSALDGRFDRGETAALLRDLGALHVEYVDHEGATVVGEAGDGRPAPSPSVA